MNPLISLSGLAMLVLLSQCQSSAERDEARPGSVVYEEVEGTVAVEAENFERQTDTLLRKWYIVDRTAAALPTPDPDGNHAEEASEGAYLEALPDTRTTHDDILTEGENFFPQPGQAGILRYPVHFNNPGKYYVWVRAHTSGTEDNGLHVGLDGEWPSTGQRMQFDGNKQTWSWESRQRTEEVHTGVPELIYLEIDEPGQHTISFSIREDGFEFDKWVMSQEYRAPEGTGPRERTLNQ